MKWSRSPSARIAPTAWLFAAWLGVFLSFGLGSPATSEPLRRVSVQVDLEGVGAIAAHVRRSLPRHLARELAANPVDYPPGSRLVVRVTEVFLSNDPGVRGGRFGGGFAMPDALEGEALVVDGRGAVIVRKRASGRSPPSSGGFAPSPYNEPRRMEALIQNFAYWIVQELR